MAETLTYTVAGLEKIEDLLKILPDKLATTVVRRAIADAAKIGQKALAAEAAKHDARGNNLRIERGAIQHLSDCTIKVTRHYSGGTEYAAIGFAWPAGAHGWLVEHGHRMVTHGTVARITSGRAPKSAREGLTGQGRVVGFVAPHPIAARAFDTALGAMQDAFTARVGKEAAKEAETP